MNAKLQEAIDRTKTQEDHLTFEECWLNGIYYLIGYTKETHPCHPRIYIWNELYNGGLSSWNEYKELPPAFKNPPGREMTLEDIELGLEIMEGL